MNRSRRRPAAAAAVAVCAFLVAAPFAGASAQSPPEVVEAAADASTPTAPAASPGTAGTAPGDRDAGARPVPTAGVDAASSRTPDEPTSEPQDVRVQGRRMEESLPKQLKGYGTRVVTVDRTQIQNAGQPDVAKTLELLAPGLHVAPKNGPFDYVDVSLHGSRTQDVLWLLDGVRLNNRLYGGTTPLDTVAASVIDHLDLVEGPEALFYGTQAVAGAINIATVPFSDRTGGSLALGVDMLGGLHADGNVQAALAAHRLVVFGSVDQSDGYQAFRDQDYEPSATARKRGYEVLTLGAKYAYDLRRDLRLTAFYEHTDARLDYALPFRVATSFNRRAEEIATGKLEYAPSSAVQVYAKGYYHLWRSQFTEFDHAIGPGGSLDGTLTSVDDAERWGFEDLGGTVVAELAPTGWFDVFAGYDFQSYRGRDAVLVIAPRSEQVHAVFAEVRTPERSTRLRLAAGARYNAPTVGPSAAVWNVTGQYAVADPLVARVNVGTAFRLPTAEELFANDPNDERGSPNLRPERSFDLEASVTGKIRPADELELSWDLVGFYRDVRDLISASAFDATTNQSVFENVAGTVHVRGGTIAGRATFQAWTLAADCTYASAEEDGPQIDKVPRHLAKGSLDWSPDALRVGATVLATYVGDTYQSFGTTDRERIDAHAVLTLAARVFLDAERRHKMSASLANVFGTVYATSLGKGVRDADGSAYTYWNLGTPRTLSLRYAYRF